jgi:hypothetical protein
LYSEYAHIKGEFKTTRRVQTRRKLCKIIMENYKILGGFMMKKNLLQEFFELQRTLEAIDKIPAITVVNSGPSTPSGLPHEICELRRKITSRLFELTGLAY